MPLIRDKEVCIEHSYTALTGENNGVRKRPLIPTALRSSAGSVFTDISW